MNGYLIILLILVFVVVFSGGSKGKCRIKPAPTTAKPKFNPPPQK